MRCNLKLQNQYDCHVYIILNQIFVNENQYEFNFNSLQFFEELKIDSFFMAY